MSTEAQRSPTRGAGMDRHIPSSRVKGAYRRAYFYDNPAFNPEFPLPNVTRYLKKADAPTLKEFAKTMGDDGAKWLENKRVLANQSVDSYRKRKGLSPKEKNVRMPKGGGAGGGGKKKG